METRVDYSIECLAVVGKLSNLIYLKNFTDKNELEMHYFINLSLDFIEQASFYKSIEHSMFINLDF